MSKWDWEQAGGISVARLRQLLAIEQAARECVRVAEKWHGVSEAGYLLNVEQHVAERQIAYDALRAALAEGSGG